MKEKQSTIELGDRVRDVVSGFEGIVTGYTTWLTGCDSVHVTGKHMEGRADAPTATFDVTRAEVLQAGEVKLPTQNTRTETKQERTKKPGGPTPKLSQPLG